MSDEKHILIVDDDVELGDLLAQALDGMSDDYRVQVVRDVDEAMVQVRKYQTRNRSFDLVITDIKMSGLSGLELLEALRAIAPGTRTIAMTAYNSPDLAARAQELGVYAYLTKPFVISEFRDIVRSALAEAVQTVAEVTRGEQVALSSRQRVAVGRELASLRTLSGATAAFLVHSGGTVLAVDAHAADADVDELCAALVDAQRAIATHLSRIFRQDTRVRQSYFGTETYNVCTYRLDDDHVAVVLFGPAVKEGQVWYYMRNAAPRLREALSTSASVEAEAGRGRGDVFDILDQFFPDRPRRRRGERRAEQTAPQAEPEPEPDEAIASLDEIDWNVPVDMDWDSLIAEADQGFEGMSFEEARRQGLVTPDLIETPADEVPEGPLPAAADVDLDWDVPLDMDWEELVADADQGFGGLSYEEARRRGLINGLPGEN